jgi:hypothetical protein
MGAPVAAVPDSEIPALLGVCLEDEESSLPPCPQPTRQEVDTMSAAAIRKTAFAVFTFNLPKTTFLRIR